MERRQLEPVRAPVALPAAPQRVWMVTPLGMTLPKRVTPRVRDAN